MKRYLFSLLLMSAANMLAHASVPSSLDGFEYGSASVPDGTEWQSPQRLGYNKLQPRAWYGTFASVEEARKVLKDHSSRHLSLDGRWKFCFSKNPDERPEDFYENAFDCSHWDDIEVPSNWNIVGLQPDGTQRYGKPIYVNQPVIFYHEVKKDDWKDGVMRTPPASWTTYEYRNEVGSYRREFTIPKTWKGMELFVEFDGVDSFFYLWVNGRYVGFSKNSRDAARFDITPYAKLGNNSIAVEVYRNSDGSFLEAQDMFRLPGIFRSVGVYATPKTHLSDLRVEADMDGTLTVESTLENCGGKKDGNFSVAYSLYQNELYGDTNRPVAVNFNHLSALKAKGKVDDVKTWTSEEPNVYVLVAELKDSRGHTIEAISTQVGFRTVEIRQVEAEDDEFGLAGRYFLVNGKPLKLKGVNRHETSPLRGHAITRSQMEEEVMMMKRANINHVRTSHYSDAPYFYYLCNKYGIWLEAEANIESHEYYYGEASLSHPVEWRAAHVARMMELAHARVNDPCVVIWSLGNEAGPGENFRASYEALKSFDSSRPVQYERNNGIVDMGSNQYPSVNWVRQAVKGTMGIKYPFHISEYAHSMGNAVGNLQDYWDAIESTNFFCGGAIWDWIDQSLYNYTSEGLRYLAYGGDFGDEPNDGQFVMNGIVFADLRPKPQYYEVKKVYQNVGIEWTGNELDIFNKNYFADDLSGYDCRYRLTADGETVDEGLLSVGCVLPRTRKRVAVPSSVASLPDDGRMYLLTVEFCLKKSCPWAEAGFVQADEQVMLSEGNVLSTMEEDGTGHPVKIVNKNDQALTCCEGDGFRVDFSDEDGSIQRLSYEGQDFLTDGGGPRLDAFRAWVNNDNWAYQNWYANGLYHLRHQAIDKQVISNADGSLSIMFKIESQAPWGARLEGGDRNWKRLVELTDQPFGPDDFRFFQTIVYQIYPDGAIELQAAIQSNNSQLVLPRLGYALTLPSDYDHLSYFGRGPIDNYPDRKTSQHIGIYQNRVEKEVEPFPKPQDMANHQDTRWCALERADGYGLLFVADGSMSFSVLPWTAQQLAMANHPHELPTSDGLHLHLDLAVTGLGGNSCGQGGPMDYDRVKAGPHTFGFRISPVCGQPTSQAVHRPFGKKGVLLISRDNAGWVSITGTDSHNSTICYTLTTSAPQRYEHPFLLREAATVRAWIQDAGVSSPAPLVFSQDFAKMEQIPVSVVYASSVESDEGDADHLTDGNPATYWHTMYSVTVASYPHWVDFDCGEVKNIKGFCYLPRQDSNNGNIKDYRIQVSQNLKEWSDPVCEGTFSFDRKEKRVVFSKPVRARYLRFTALSANDGQDFATGAGFTILEE